MKIKHGKISFFSVILSLLLMLETTPVFASDGAADDAANAPATREYVIAAFAEAAGLAGGDGVLAGFSDAREVDARYAKGVEAAIAAGAVKGYEDGTLRPKETITRAEALVILSRCLPELEAVRDAKTFDDVPDWAQADVARLSAAGLTVGFGDSALGASDPLRMDQVDMLTARVIGKDLQNVILVANSSERIYRRHTSTRQLGKVYERDGTYFTTDLRTVAQRACYFFGPDEVRYVTADSFFTYQAGTGITATLQTPEGHAEKLAFYQTCLVLDDEEELAGLEERDGELFLATKLADKGVISTYLADTRAVYGHGYDAEVEDGTELEFTCSFDAESLEVKDARETLRMPDGSEFLLSSTDFSFDEAFPDLTAPGSVLAPLFDESVEQMEITVVFAPGTSEEETYVYTLPASVAVNFDYGVPVEIYEDPACTVPFAGVNGRAAFTVYLDRTPQIAQLHTSEE